MKSDTITITSTAAGAVADQRTRAFEGKIEAFYLSIGTLGNTVDITITDDKTGAAVLIITNASASGWYPVRIPTVDAAGAALLYAAGGTGVGTKIPINGALKIAVAQPGNSKTGTLYVFVEDED